MRSEAGDLISAGSVLLAVLGILFGLWYSDIAEALEVKPSKHPEDDVEKAHQVRGVLVSKALPLSVAASFVTLLLLPDSLAITAQALRVIRGNAQGPYDAVAASLVALTLASFAFAAYGLRLTWRLLRLRRTLSSEPRD